jgi:hypothetical protein
MRLAKTLPLGIAESFDRGVFRIGSLRYYARIEDDIRRDLSEGQRPVEIANDSSETLVVDAASFNEHAMAAGAPYRITDPRIKINLKPGVRFRFESEVNAFVFCTSILDPQSTLEERSKFGSETRYLIDPEAFAVAIGRKLLVEAGKSSCIFQPRTTWATLGYKYGKVIYQDKVAIDHTAAEARSTELRFSITDVFVKPEIFKSEREFRFIWYFANADETEMCPLPRDFLYVDLEVSDSASLWAKQ